MIYLVFEGAWYYPLDGVDDLMLATPNRQEAEAKYNELGNGFQQWAQLVQVDAQGIVLKIQEKQTA